MDRAWNSHSLIVSVNLAGRAYFAHAHVATWVTTVCRLGVCINGEPRCGFVAATGIFPMRVRDLRRVFRTRFCAVGEKIPDAIFQRARREARREIRRERGGGGREARPARDREEQPRAPNRGTFCSVQQGGNDSG